MISLHNAAARPSLRRSCGTQHAHGCHTLLQPMRSRIDQPLMLLQGHCCEEAVELNLHNDIALSSALVQLELALVQLEWGWRWCISSWHWCNWKWRWPSSRSGRPARLLVGGRGESPPGERGSSRPRGLDPTALAPVLRCPKPRPAPPALHHRGRGSQTGAFPSEEGPRAARSRA